MEDEHSEAENDIEKPSNNLILVGLVEDECIFTFTMNKRTAYKQFNTSTVAICLHNSS